MPLLATALEGAVFTGCLSRIPALSRRLRVGSLEAILAGLLLGTICCCVLSLRTIGQEATSWWVQRFQSEASQVYFNPIRRVIKQTGEKSRRGTAQESDVKPAEADLLAAFKGGVDGCFLVRSLRLLDATEENIAALALTNVTEKLLNDAAPIGEVTRAMQALWLVEPWHNHTRIRKKITEFRFLSRREVGRFSEAAEKIQYARRFGMVFDLSYQKVLAGVVSDGQLKEAKEFLKRTQLLDRAKARLDHLPGNPMEQPVVRVQTTGAGLSRTYHLGQIHPTDPNFAYDPEDVAVTVAYQLSMLHELKRLKPTYVLQESNPAPRMKGEEADAAERELLALVESSFDKGIPSSFATVDHRQLATLYTLGAGRIYQALNRERVSLVEDLSNLEMLAFQSAATRSRTAQAELETAAKASSRNFSAVLERLNTFWWDEERLTMDYRERRAAERIAEVVQIDPTAKIAVIFGGGHNFQTAFDRVQEHGSFTVMRLDWFHSSWFSLKGVNVDPFSTPAEERNAAVASENVSPGDLGTFHRGDALEIAVRKLGPDKKFNLEQAG
jgi:hypothetical protein